MHHCLLAQKCIIIAGCADISVMSYTNCTPNIRDNIVTSAKNLLQPAGTTHKVASSNFILSVAAHVVGPGGLARDGEALVVATGMNTDVRGVTARGE